MGSAGWPSLPHPRVTASPLKCEGTGGTDRFFNKHRKRTAQGSILSRANAQASQEFQRPRACPRANLVVLSRGYFASRE